MREAIVPSPQKSNARGRPWIPGASAGAVWWATAALLAAAAALSAAIRFPETSLLLAASASVAASAVAFGVSVLGAHSPAVPAASAKWRIESLVQASLVLFGVGSVWLHAVDLSWRLPPLWLMGALLPAAIGWLWNSAFAGSKAAPKHWGARRASESLLPALLLTFAVMLAVPFPSWLSWRASNTLWIVAGLEVGISFMAAASSATVNEGGPDRTSFDRIGMMIGSSLFAIGVSAASIGELSGERSIAAIAFIFFACSSLTVVFTNQSARRSVTAGAETATRRSNTEAETLPSESGSARVVDLVLPGALVAVALTVALLDRTQTPHKDQILEWLAIGSLVALFVRQISTMLRQGDALSQLRSGQLELSRRANIDMLTGLPNRESLTRRLVEELERANRYQQPLSLVFVDVDRFKAINDRFGHLAGDSVLADVAAMLRTSARTIDFVGRYGGEEFLIVAPGTWTEDAIILGERIRSAVESGSSGGSKHDLAVTISVGIAGYPEHAPDLQSLIESADAALYASKRLGRNRVTVATAKSPSSQP